MHSSTVRSGRLRGVIRPPLSGAFVILVLLAGGCAGGETRLSDTPLAELDQTPASARRHIAAMEAQETIDPDDPAYVRALERMMYVSFYTVDARTAAFERLEARDPERLRTVIRRHMPRMELDLNEWRQTLCALIADRGWTASTPALVSSWARPIPLIDDLDRAEFKALAALHGRERVPDVVFDLFVESKGAVQQGLRTRCWAMLHRLGARDRLVELVAGAAPAPDDGMLVDLHAGATQLGVVPETREEILWLRELRKPEHRGFWEDAQAALAQVGPAAREDLALRDVAVIVAASRHAPELLSARRDELYRRVARRLEGQTHHRRRSAGYDGGVAQEEALRASRDRLGWGDCCAMLMACQALDEPAVVDHLFDFAERDRADRSTEYGGLLVLDDRGRFEVLEFRPTFRVNDQRFQAPNAMFQRGYTGAFHFHFHVQDERNASYAGPGLGDFAYADATRANCLVLTSVTADRMNVDFYRHGRVVVDLGEVTRAR